MASASGELPVPDPTAPSTSSGGAGRRRKRGKGKKKAEAGDVERMEEDASLGIPSPTGEGDELGDAENKAAHASGTEDGGEAPQGEDQTKEAAVSETEPPTEAAKKKKKKTHRAGRKHRAKIAAAMAAQETDDTVQATEETEDLQSVEQAEEQSDTAMSEAPLPVASAASPAGSAGEELLAIAAEVPIPESQDRAETLEDQLKEKEDELQALASRYQDLEQECDGLRESLQDTIKRENASRDRKIGDLEERLTMFEHRLQENSRYVGEVEEIVAKERETSASLRQELQTLMAANRSMSQVVSNAMAAQENLAKQHAEALREERAKVSGRDKDLARLKRDLERREHGEERLTRELEQANARHATMLQEKKQAEMALSGMEEEYKRCEADRLETVKRVDELESKLGDRDEERQALKDADDEIKGRDRKIIGLESNNKRLAYLNKQLSAQVEKGLEVDEETKEHLTAIKAEIAEATDQKTRSASAGGDQYARSRELVAQMSSINGTWFEIVEQLTGRFEKLKVENEHLERKIERLEAIPPAVASHPEGQTAAVAFEADDTGDLPAETDEEGEDPSRITSSDAGRRESTPGTTHSFSSTGRPRSLDSPASYPPPSLSPLLSPLLLSSPSSSPSPLRTSPHSGVSWKIILVFLAFLLPLVFVDISLCITRYREIELWRAANMETLLRFWNTGGGSTVSALNDWRSISGAGCENNLLIAWWGSC